MRIYLCTCRQIYLLISNFCIPYVSGLTRTIIHTVYTQYFWQGNHQIYGRIRFWSTLRVCGASVCTCARARNQCTCCAGAQLQISVYHTFPFLHKFLYTSHCVWARMIRPAWSIWHDPFDMIYPTCCAVTSTYVGSGLALGWWMWPTYTQRTQSHLHTHTHTYTQVVMACSWLWMKAAFSGRTTSRKRLPSLTMRVQTVGVSSGYDLSEQQQLYNRVQCTLKDCHPAAEQCGCRRWVLVVDTI